MVNTLDMIIGPMFSGKTSRLLQISRKIDQERDISFIIKPDFDKRYEESDDKTHIISHDGLKRECYIVGNLINFILEIEKKVVMKSNSIRSESGQSIKSVNNIWVIIDEGQFFDNLREFCEKILSNSIINKIAKVKIVVSGLDGDYKKQPIGEILSLIPISDSVIKLKGKCEYCDEESILSKRICRSVDQVLIGGNDLYKPTCRFHHSNDVF